MGGVGVGQFTGEAEVFGDLPQFDVAVFRRCLQLGEGLFGGHLPGAHQDSFGLADDVAGAGSVLQVSVVVVAPGPGMAGARRPQMAPQPVARTHAAPIESAPAIEQQLATSRGTDAVPPQLELTSLMRPA